MAQSHTSEAPSQKLGVGPVGYNEQIVLVYEFEKIDWISHETECLFGLETRD